jgi:ATP-dependent protease ClpP protease subunit
MPSWSQILEEIKKTSSNNPLDSIRRQYIKKLYEKRKRNIICYYSGWLQKPGVGNIEINDNDKNSLMAVVHGLDRDIGLDLLLHTPGGGTAATESLVDYLRAMFGTDIVAFIPQIAMSAGTMIACAAKEIYMGKQSSLGPIDPQFSGVSANGVIEEFNKAKEEIKNDPSSIPVWQSIIGKYHPTFLGDCEKAIEWSETIVAEWLLEGMFKDLPDGSTRANAVAKKLSDNKEFKNHARHISLDKAKTLGLSIKCLEDDNELQDLVLTVHHCYMHSFSGSNAIKIVENQNEQDSCLHAGIQQK